MSFSLEERTRPPIIIVPMKTNVKGTCVLRERTKTIPFSIPAPIEWSEIFDQKLMSVATTAIIEVEKMNPFKKTGI